MVLEALAARPGETVRAEALAEALWGERLPASWPKVVQGCVSRLRKVLGAGAIVTAGAGYRLALHRDDVDHLCFEDLLVHATQLLAGEPERARYASGQALSLWRGDPLDRLTDWEAGRIEAERLVERRRDAEDLFAESAIRAGRHRDVLGDLHRMVAQQPTRERRWGLLALGQYQAGRQAEALATIQRARATLVNEFGLDPGPALAELEEAILRQDPALLPDGAVPTAAAVCPYLGLVAYDIGDAPAYFGREADVSACLARLDEAGVLAVVGPSGSGKSSLIRAGVAAALVRDGHQVRIVTPGAHPEDVLVQAPRGNGAVFVVDQCEEALALAETSPEREAFFSGLVDVAARGRLVISLRADRLGELAEHPEFAHLVERGLYLLGAMGPAQLRSAIESPAAQAGLRLEPGLVDLLVRDAERSSSALPLLSHVLRQTWRRREGNTLTVKGYTATGGVREAVAQSAERLYRELTPTQQHMLRDLMVRLVSADDSGEPVRTRVARRTVAPDDEHVTVVEALVGARLLSSDGDTVEIAHESLALAWPRLRSWLDDDVDGLRILRHLAVAAESWDELGRPDSELYRGVRQARAVEWRDRVRPSLSPAERDFLDASCELADEEHRATEAQVRRERRLNRRLRLGLSAVAALLAVAVVAGGIAITARAQAAQDAAVAEQQARAADARRLGAEALRSPEIDRALLLAVAGARLDGSADTVNNLTGVLDRVPQLVGAARSTSLSSLSVSPDGTRVARGEVIRGVSILDAGTLVETARNDDLPVAGVRFDPSGSTLAVAVNPWTPNSVARVDPVPLRLLDASSARLLPHQPGGTPPGLVIHHSFGFSPDGRWLVAGFISPSGLPANTVVQVWDTTALARPKWSFTVPYLVSSIEVGKGARRIYAMSDTGDLHLLEPATQRELRSIHTTKSSTALFAPVAVALTHDGTRVAVRDADQVRLLDAERLTTTASFREEGVIGAPLAISSDDRNLAYLVDGTAVVRPLAEASGRGTPYPSGDAYEPAGLAFAQGGRTLMAARDDGLLLAWDTIGSRKFLPSAPPKAGTIAGRYLSSRVSPDGRTVAYLRGSTVDASVSLQFLDVRSNSLGPAISTTETLDFWIGLAWRPDSTAVATVLGTERLHVWDRVTGKQIEEHRAPGERLTTVAFSGDGSRLLVGTRDGWVKPIAGTSPRAGAPVKVSDSSPVTTLAVDGPGGRAVATTDDGVRVLDLDAGTVTRTLAVDYTTSAAAWILDGSAVVISGLDYSQGGAGVVSVYDATTWSRRSSATGRAVAGGNLLQLDAKGQRFLTAFADRVALWDAQSGTLVRSLGVEDRTVGGFDPARSTLVLASTEAAVSHWDPGSDAAIAAACDIVGRRMTEAEWRTYLPDREREEVC